jgi:hypothetical protein
MNTEKASIGNHQRKMDYTTFDILNAMTPFYNFRRGFTNKVFSDEKDEKMSAQLAPLNSMGELSYEPDECVWILSIESGKKFHKTMEEKTIYMLDVTANKTHFDDVNHIVIKESTDNSELKGAVVEWKRGNNDLVPTHSVSIMDVLRLSRSIGIDDRRGPEKFELVSHSKKKLVLKVSVDNFST